jgi:hypothetical protein
MIRRLAIPLLILTNLISLTSAYLSAMCFRDFEWEFYYAQDEFKEKKAEMEQRMERQRCELQTEIGRLHEKLEALELQQIQVKDRPSARMMRN